MGIELKEEFKTDASVTDAGYLTLRQGGDQILMSASQVKILLEWLQDGNGLRLEQNWDNGVDQVEG